MANVKIELNDAGVKELLKSQEIKEACREVADRVQRSAGEGFVLEERNYPERSGYSVRVDSAEAARKNSKHNTLLKALGTG